MTGVLAATAVLALLVAAAALVISALLARRYRELRTALLSAGVLQVEQVERATQPPDGSFLPAVDSRVPAGIQATATDGTVIDNRYLDGQDVVVAFLMDQCTTCTAKLPELRTALAGLPAGWPRPVVVLSGSADACSHYRSALEPVAHVVEDGQVKSGAGVVRAFRLHSFPAVLVLSGGAVRRSGMTAREVELAAA